MNSMWRIMERMQVKLLCREWIGILLFLGIGVSIFTFCWQLDGELLLASEYPFRATFFWVWMQYFPILYLSSTFFFKDRIDTNASLRIRPESTVGLFTSSAFAVVRVTATWGAVIFAFVLLANVFASNAPCSPLLYIYYFLTLAIPAAIFMTGFAYLLFSVTRSAAAGFVIPLVVVWLTLNFSGESWQGILNFTGINLPNEYSEVTGFTPRLSYMLHRLGWVLLGIGMVFLSSLTDLRPENGPSIRAKIRLVGMGTFLVGVVCLLGVWGVQEQKYARRALYAEVYNRYAEVTKLSPESIDIEVTPEANRLSGKARLSLRNNSATLLKDVVLYLNPGLRVTGLKEGAQDVSYRRDGQVLVVSRSVSPGNSVELELTYEGEIDARVFYLDIPEETIRESSTWNEGLSRKGKAYCFLEEDQIVLYPEALWYPTSVPPVNVESPYSSEVHFSRYSLCVKSAKGLTVLSQGKREEGNEQVVFKPEHPLSGISLVAGRYEKREYQLNSTKVEVYLYPGHYDLAIAHFDAYADKIAKEIRSFRTFPDQLPFSYLRLVETPKTLHAYYRDRHEGSNLVQPELICFPEKMPRGWTGKEEFAQLMAKSNMYSLSAMVFDHLTNEKLVERGRKERGWLKRLTLGESQNLSSSGYLQLPNPLYVSSLVGRYVRAVNGEEFPGLDVLLRNAEKKKWFVDGPSLTPKLEDFSRLLLAQYSLRELLNDVKINSLQMQDIFRAKALELFMGFHRRGVSAHELALFFDRHLGSKQFRTFELEKLQVAALEELEVDFRDVLNEVYESKPGEPVFLIRDVKVQIAGRATSSRYILPSCMSFMVYNDSDFDGDISVDYMTLPLADQYRKMRLFKTYTIPARKGKRIFFYTDSSDFMTLSPSPVSRNHKHMIKVSQEVVSSISDTVSREEMITREDFFAGEILVDNGDEGFKVPRQEPSLLQRWMNKPQQRMNIYADNLKGWQFYGEGFGFVEKDVYTCVVGFGGGEAEWQVDLPQVGRYEVFAFVGGGCISGSFSRFKKMKKDVSSISQHYVVEHGEGKSDVAVELLSPPKNYMSPGDKWYSLGTYDFPAGKAKVVLRDKGVEGQLIWADAVKWVKVK